MMTAGIQLIVGLGNPGVEYADTRHNAGVWFVEQLCEHAKVRLAAETKFKGHIGTFTLSGQLIRVLVPATYMNHSGQSIVAVAHFYKIPAETILVVHDDLDLPPGCARLKRDGGDGGHNGLKDTAQHLGTKAFYRLRLGIGHPGNREDVLDYVLHRPSLSDKKRILSAIEHAQAILPTLIEGKLSQAMTTLHTLAK